MAPDNSAARRLCVLSLLSIAILSSASDDSSLCPIPSPAPRHHLIGINESLPLLRSFQLNAGNFFGGEDIHFAKDDDTNASYSYATRSFSLLPHSVQRTDDTKLLHVAATLILSGGRTRQAVGHRRRHSYSYVYVGDHVVTFHLEGYYSRTSAELCMVGSGTYSEDDGSIENLPGAVLRLRVPNPPSLSDPFVTGSFKGDGFRDISLVAYAEGDNYKYSDESASCPPPSTASGALQLALGPKFSCTHLKKQLVTWYKLRNDDGADTSSSNGGGASPLLGLHSWWSWNRRTSMHVGRVLCTDDGAVRAYATFSNETKTWQQRLRQPRPRFMVEEEAVVAEGHWDSARRMLCLRACRVVRSGKLSLAVQPNECGGGMSFWFPGVWTMRDRSAVAGVLWNSSQAAGDKDSSGVISVSSIGVDDYRSNFTDVKYSYNVTMLEEAKKQYHKYKKQVKGSFQAPNYTHHDFEFAFYETRGMGGDGRAYPVTIGSAMVYGDRLAADASFSRDAAVDGKPDLLNVSYDIHRYLPPASWVRPTNVSSYSIPMEEHRTTAEGVFDPKTGILCMIGCREHNGSTDCLTLITVQFASVDERAWGAHGRGCISSLRDKTNDLYFEKRDITLSGMYSGQLSESISRMDLESIMLVVSTTLPCVFTILQILHTKRHPEAAAATSITMLVVLALGYVAPLLIASEALFLSRRRYYVPFLEKVPYELSQAMLRAPTLIAFVLQLRLIQLAWSGRKSAAVDPTKAENSSAAEKRALWICLPLYVLGGAVTVIAHVISGRAAGEDSLAVRVSPEPPTLWEDLVSSAGLALDGFLLPQVVMNAFSWGGAGVRAVSPWLYAGVTVVRAMPHVYDVVRSQGYVRSRRPSYVYAGPRDDRFGVAWDIAVPCVTAVLAVLVFLQQRKRRGAGTFLLRSRRSGGYEMVSTI